MKSLASCFKKHITRSILATVQRIAIVGTESTGKSTLARELSQRFATVFVPEMARIYLEEIGSKWTYNDVLHIARLQLQKEDELLPFANKWLFCDTEMICIKVWLDFYKLPIPVWLTQQIEQRSYTHFLLMDIDLPWEPDTLRENELNRVQLFNAFKVVLKQFNKPYTIISGSETQRADSAAAVLNSLSC